LLLFELALLLREPAEFSTGVNDGTAWAACRGGRGIRERGEAKGIPERGIIQSLKIRG
jgi:hypothetical protein